MGRFCAIILFLTATVYFLPLSPDSANTQQVANKGSAELTPPQQSEAKSETVRLAELASDEWRSNVIAEYMAIEEAPLNLSLNAKSEDIPLPLKALKSAAIDREKVAPSHIPSSAAAEEVGPELEKLSLVDLKVEAQEELARLGCYNAKVDGLWGRKSRAAIKKFNRAIAANLSSRPSAKLVKALRRAPDGICSRPCASDNSSQSCTTAAIPPAKKTEATEDGEQNAYLPPWMKGQKLASTDPASGLVAVAEDDPQANTTKRNGEKRHRVKKHAKRIRRRQASYRSKRRYRTSGSRRYRQRWRNLSGWPGTDR